MAGGLGGREPLRGRGGRHARRELRHLCAAPERHGQPSPRPRAERRDPGRARALAPDAWLSHPLATRLRPCRHLDPERGREATRPGGSDAPRPRARGVHRAHLAMARGDGAHDHGAVPAARRLARLQPRTVHPRRGLLASGDGLLRAALGTGLDLSREPHRQLVPVPPDGDLRPRGRARGDGRRAHLRAVSVRRRGRHRRNRDRDGAAGHHPRGRRRRRPPRRRAIPRCGRPRGRGAVRRAGCAGDRGRAGRPRVRVGRAQDHARPRSARLRDRSRPRAAGADGDRARRQDERPGR